MISQGTRVTTRDVDGWRLREATNAWTHHLGLCEPCREYRDDDPFTGVEPCQIGRGLSGRHDEMARLFGERF